MRLLTHSQGLGPGQAQEAELAPTRQPAVGLNHYLWQAVSSERCCLEHDLSYTDPKAPCHSHIPTHTHHSYIDISYKQACCWGVEGSC